MTGREFILYILENGLEDEPIFKDGKFIGFLTIGEVAAQMDVGIATVATWIAQGRLEYVRIGGMIYIPGNYSVKEVDNDGF
jgi:excisionase family DNA binding protein